MLAETRRSEDKWSLLGSMLTLSCTTRCVGGDKGWYERTKGIFAMFPQLFSEIVAVGESASFQPTLATLRVAPLIYRHSASNKNGCRQIGTCGMGGLGTSDNHRRP